MADSGLLIQLLLDGLSMGSRLFLVAVGLSLIFGVLDVLNFTHGVLYMLGAYVGITFADGITVLGLSIPAVGFWWGVVSGVVVVGAIGGLLERGFLRRIYDQEPLDQLLLTFAFVLILTDLTRSTFGTRPHLIDPPAIFATTTWIGGFGVPTYRLFVIGVSIVVLIGLVGVLHLSSVGRMIRATTSDRTMARLLGINVPLLYTGVFVVGAGLAGLGGALAAPLGSVTPELGNYIIIQAFLVVVIGGLGSFVGAFVGAYAIGILMALDPVIAVDGGGELMPFVLMIVVLLYAPEGLFGGVET